jgi:hypothetical protein
MRRGRFYLTLAAALVVIAVLLVQSALEGAVQRVRDRQGCEAFDVCDVLDPAKAGE